MITIFTIAEFRNLQIGDNILVRINDQYVTAVVEDYAFFNHDTSEPGWEIMTDCGFISIDSAYKMIRDLSYEEVGRMSLEQFKALKVGNILYVERHGSFAPALVIGLPEKSQSLDNIIGGGDDWEVETSLGFIHNDSAFARA